ncbi:hypothetical protein [Deinococcus aerophilus]|uniref:hypothetical protein n=1 Tax=Deinococcus aerophilus TaxID=522488 RepID=UPI00166C2767|nr:hypothetical protein [Deinococcus aerophilus]
MVIGETPRFNAVVRDAGGNEMAAAVTYTSSQPQVIEVDDEGVLTVKRLSAAGKPVVITASAGTQRDSLNVSTFGLEMALGTYVWNTQKPEDSPGLFMAVRYRPESGKTQASTFTVETPGSEQLSCPLFVDDTTGWCWWALPDATRFPNGEYQASLFQNGVTYTTRASLDTREGLLGFVAQPSVSTADRQVTFVGEPPAGTQRLFSYIKGPGVVGDQIRGDQADAVFANALPATLNVGSGVAANTYAAWITAMTGNLDSFAEVLPERLNASATYAGEVTLP